MISAIASFLGMIIRFIYSIVNNNYFISIILFTILTKLILFPLYLTQIKSTEKIRKIGPMDQKIRDKYKNDKQKQAEELAKLYSENKQDTYACRADVHGRDVRGPDQYRGAGGMGCRRPAHLEIRNRGPV